MKFYFAASGCSGHCKLMVKNKISHALVSYAAFIRQGKMDEHLMRARSDGRMKLMLDSGAFTNMATPGYVTLKGFMEYLDENEKKFEEVACLDDLRSRAKTIENYRKLRKAGHDVMMVDHMHFTWTETLRPFYKSGEKVCFGGMVRSSNKVTNAQFKKRVEKRVDAARSDPKSKIHLFGIGTRVKRFLPHLDVVDSIDTASWFMGPGRFGAVVVADIDDDGWPRLKHEDYRHMKGDVRELFRKAGLDPAHHLGRIDMALRAYKRFFKVFEARYQKAKKEGEDLIQKSVEGDDGIIYKSITMDDASRAIEEEP
jgi:hypothetical protein